MKKWSEEETTKAMGLLADGKTASEVAEVLGRSRNSIISLYQRRKKDGEFRRDMTTFWTAEEHDIAVEMWRNDEPVEMIALRLKRSKEAILARARINKECFPFRSSKGNLAHVTRNILYHSERLEKPTPENTVIQYEYQEIPIPEDAKLVSFVDLEPRQCKWACDSFWDEFSAEETKFCGKPVFNYKGTSMQKAYCECHYKASVK